LNQNLEIIKDRAFTDDMITSCDFKNGILLISLLDGVLLSFRLQDNELLELAQINLNHEIFGASMTSDGTFAFVGLQDAPLYSLVILKVETMSILEQRSLLSIMDFEGYQDILTNTKLIRSEMEDVETTINEMYEGLQNLNCDLPCTIARSIRILSVPNDVEAPTFSYIICSFSDGRALTIGFDHGKANKMEFVQELQHVARNESVLRENVKETAMQDY
jgi:hypothetical protein